MLTRYFILWAITLALAGCGETKSYSLGGGYFVEGEKNNAPLIEPGGGSVNRRLVYRSGDKEEIICRNIGHLENPGGSGTFEKRTYGDNLVYIEEVLEDKTHPYAKHLRVFSPRSGQITIVEDLLNYVKLDADDDGIKCYRSDDAKPNGDPNPKVFTPDDLKKR